MFKKNSVRRALAAGVSALALVGVGVSAASAADTITPDSRLGGTFYLASAADGTDFTPTTVPWGDGTSAQVIAEVALGDNASNFPTPTGAETVRVFLAPQGQEYNPAAWNAYADQGAAPVAGVSLPNVSPTNLIAAGTGTPAGALAVKAAGGDYSLGFAFLKTNGKYVVDHGAYFIHVHITAGTGAFTYSQVEVAKAASTTTLTVPATSPAENASFSLSATVAPAAATGTVQFSDGGTALGSPVAVSGGTASLTVAAGLSAATHSITATYSGDSTYASSTDTKSLTVTGAPKTTTTTVTANPALTGAANQSVALVATVASASGTPTGSVAFSASNAGAAAVPLATAPVTAAGTASITTTGLGAGSWVVTAAFTGTGVYQPSSGTTSAPLVLVAAANPAAPDPQNVTVKVDQGKLEITTPWTAANPLDLGTLQLNQADSTFELAAPVEFASATDITKAIKISNSRSDSPHFTAQVNSTDFTGTQAGSSFGAGYAGLVGLAQHQLSGNSLLSSNVHVTDVAALSNTAATFATYDGSTLGTAWISGNITIKGVPSSTPSGTYTATLTFTAF